MCTSICWKGISMPASPSCLYIFSVVSNFTFQKSGAFTQMRIWKVRLLLPMLVMGMNGANTPLCMMRSSAVMMSINTLRTASGAVPYATSTSISTRRVGALVEFFRLPVAKGPLGMMTV